jgi:hypothetical protein
VLFECCEVDNIMFTPVSRHAPGDALFCIRECGTECIMLEYLPISKVFEEIEGSDNSK